MSPRNWRGRPVSRKRSWAWAYLGAHSTTPGTLSRPDTILSLLPASHNARLDRVLRSPLAQPLIPARFGLTSLAIQPMIPPAPEGRPLHEPTSPETTPLDRPIGRAGRQVALALIPGSKRNIRPGFPSAEVPESVPQGPRRMRKLLFGLIPLVAAVAAGWLIVLDRQGRLVWDHWDETKRGVLYRSGQLTPRQFTQAHNRYGIRTVVNLQMPGEELEAERALAREIGVDFVNLPMPGDGFGEEWQFREILKIIDDPERRPVLVHCARGTCRTGAAVAMYRFERDGWTIDDVAVEMPPADLSLWMATGLHLCDGQAQAGLGLAPARDAL